MSLVIIVIVKNENLVTWGVITATLNPPKVGSSRKLMQASSYEYSYRKLNYWKLLIGTIQLMTMRAQAHEGE